MRPLLLSRHHDSRDSKHDSTTPRYHDTMQEAVPKVCEGHLVKRCPRIALLLEEKKALADMVYAYSVAEGFRTSENEIARIAINFAD